MKKSLIAIMGLLLICGCLGNNTTSTETKIQSTQGIGVLEFKAVVDDMIASTYNYLLLSIRNNAEGSSAKNIMVSLENVEPFMIYECNQEHAPNEKRTSVCNQFFDDVGEAYRTHKINNMLPDEEIQFFWNIRAPTEQEIVNLAYDQTIYYSMSYDYTTTVTQTIAGISQAEYLERSKEGAVTLSGQTISSPGEVKIESKTQQPIIYTEGSSIPLDFTLQFELDNVGTGVPKPGSTIIVAVKSDESTSVNEELARRAGWLQYSEIQSAFDAKFPLIEFEELTSTIREGLWITSIDSSLIRSSSYSLILPVQFNTGNVYEPQKILTFSAYISYTYLKEGSTSISVYPVE
ncbi:MAG: hypothetical protein WC307_03180 [Candidatus Nanoarchaeia archaeon]|jgi:hypothetical protein